VRLASSIEIGAEDATSTKRFAAAELRSVMRSANLVGMVSFWKALEQLGNPEARVRIHALGVLRELARASFADCGGRAYSLQHAEVLRYCGFKPVGIRSPGLIGTRE